MGETTGRYFRDKLAMRTRARDRGIRVPDFSGIFNYDDLRHFFTHVQGPWLIKPRWEASSVGIRKLHTPNDIWPILDELGDRQSDYLVEKMIPGDVFHVDSLVSEKQVVFAEVHQYRKPLLEVMQGGGIFATCTVDRTSETEQTLLSVHDTVVKHFGMLRGVTHTEYIRGREDNQVYFLETAARVGGVHIADLVEASTGVNLWREWAKIEISQGTTPYHVEARRREYSGLIVSLTRQEFPDSSQFTDSEIVWRMNDNPYHIGLVVRAPSRARVLELLSDYETRFYRDYWASMPAASAATA
jgi:biotin carboxylase